MPPGVTINDIAELITRSAGTYDNEIAIIFKCKDDCKTIINDKNLRQMRDFIAQVTDDPVWSKMCIRDLPRSRSYADGVGCDLSSYHNITKNFEAYLDKYDYVEEELLIK